MLMFASAALLFASCGKENDIQNDFSGEEITLQVFTSMYIDGGGRFKLSLITNNNNPYFRAEYGKPSQYYEYVYEYDNDISVIGSISSFSDISVVPANWTKEVSVKEKNGYVCRSIQIKGGYQFYWKLYVKEIVKDAAGNILAVKCIVSKEWNL